MSCFFARVACDAQETKAHALKHEADDARSFGTTRSYWLHRTNALFSGLLKLLEETGDPEVKEALSEASRCTKQMRSEAVRQDAQQLQVVLKRFNAVCKRLTRAACTEVPGGKDRLEKMAQCSKILMRPEEFSVLELENPYLRPEHEVDLSSIAPPSDQDSTNESAGISQAAARHGAGSG